MNIISIDLEMNQPTGTIIQIGYVIADVKTRKLKISKSIIINTLEEIHPEIERLTGITQDDVDNSEYALSDAYRELCEDMNKFQVTKHPLQWGTDHFELRNQLNISWEEYTFRRRAHDIKSLYQLYQMSKPNSKTISGLQRSLKQLDMEWDNKFGKPHDALADAYNTLLTYFKIADKMRLFDEIEKVVANVSKKKI